MRRPNESAEPSPRATTRQVILQAGVEGGSLSIIGCKHADAPWRFAVTKNESMLADLLDDEDGGSGPSYEESKWVTSFEAALALLHAYGYPWHQFFPVTVHQEFRDRILTEVERLGGTEERRRWQREVTG